MTAGDARRTDFVHLHVHSDYSLLDGAALLRDLSRQAAALGMPAIALTDHGNMSGVEHFLRLTASEGVKGIVGLEIYLQAQAEPIDGAPAGADATHLTLLAATSEGLQNLFRMSSVAGLNHYVHRPVVDMALLEQYSSGIIATTGCPSGEFQARLRRGDERSAQSFAGQLQDIFGRENVYCEVTDHGLAYERSTFKEMFGLADRMSLPVVATNDVHYTFASDADAHEVLLCLQTGQSLADPYRFRFDARDFYLKSADEMRRVWSERPEFCDNTMVIAERCNVTLMGRDLWPSFPLSPGQAEDALLRDRAESGLTRRLSAPPSSAYLDRLDQELSAIETTSFANYFLILADLCEHARAEGIVVGPGRGTASGSLTAYALGITAVDPVEHGLLFERFMNTRRIMVPDIDLDLDERGREELIRYAKQRYGDDHVAEIITYRIITAEQAVRDSARILGYADAMADRVIRVMPPERVLGRWMSLGASFDPSHDRYSEGAAFRALFESDADARKVVNLARGLEGLKRQWGVHAAAVVLSGPSLMDAVPITRAQRDGPVITQFEMDSCERIGLLQLDLLPADHLSLINRCLTNVADAGLEVPGLSDLPLDDADTFNLLAQAETLGVFQFESDAMRAMLRMVAPNEFRHLPAVLAMYRPGPLGAQLDRNYAARKREGTGYETLHPELDDVLSPLLEETYGLILYQEQVMETVSALTGYSLEDSDLLRRALGKRKKEILEAEYQPFEAAMSSRGYSQEAIHAFWDHVVYFSDIAFSKSHAVAYGLVAYWMAYLKTHYPVAFMAAVLSTADGGTKRARYISECRRLAIAVVPPDVNRSGCSFIAADHEVVYGLNAVAGALHDSVDAIVAARSAGGPFRDLKDLLWRAEITDTETIRVLIKAGALDTLGDRGSLMETQHRALTVVRARRRAAAADQLALVPIESWEDPLRPPPGLYAWDRPTALGYEHEVLGDYVSDHPLNGFEPALREMADTTPSALAASDVHKQGETITLGGFFPRLHHQRSRGGIGWAYGELADRDGSVEVWMLPGVYQAYAEHLIAHSAVVVRGDVRCGDGRTSLVARQVLCLERWTGGRNLPVVVPSRLCTPETATQLRKILDTNGGDTSVTLHREHGVRASIHQVRLDQRVTPSARLFSELRAALGDSGLLPVEAINIRK